MTALNRNWALDAVRGVAIGLVVIWHLIAPLAPKYVPSIAWVFSLAWSGVDLFFVLSGFLIGGILMGNRGADRFFATFYARRILRILPLYLVLLPIFAWYDPADWHWSYATMTQNVTWAARDTFGPNIFAQTWSLALEEQFYLIFPLIVRFVPFKRLPYLLTALVALAPLIRLACLLAGKPHAAYLLLPARMDALALGALLAWAKEADVLAAVMPYVRWSVVPLALGVVGLAYAAMDELAPPMALAGYSLIAAFYTCVVALAIGVDRPPPLVTRPLIWAGLGAYSIYLFHQGVIVLGYAIFGARPVALIGMVIALALIGVVCWKLVERPLIAFGHKRFRYRPVDPS